jgi:hypothetical protein
MTTAEIAIPAGKAAATTKLYFAQKPGYFRRRYCHETRTTGTFGKKLPRLYGLPQSAGPALIYQSSSRERKSLGAYGIMTGWICRNNSDFGYFLRRSQWTERQPKALKRTANLTKRKHDTDRETKKHHVVSTSRTKEPLGTQSTPEDCRGEKGVMTRAGEAKLSVLGANVLERHLEIQDTGRNKGENQGGDHLTDECVIGLDVGVVC